MKVRVAALARRADAILLARHRKDGKERFLLPGGGVDDAEETRTALARELREEAAVACDVGDLRYVIEARDPHGARHIVQFVFDVTLRGEPGISTDPRVVACEWHPIAQLRSLPFLPSVGPQLADDLEQWQSPPLRYLLAPWEP